MEEGNQKAQLLYCSVGNVTRHDVAVARAAHATVVTIGVRVQSDALDAHVSGRQEQTNPEIAGWITHHACQTCRRCN